MIARAASSGGKSRGPARRLILPLALVVLSAVALCAVFGFALAHQSDLRHQQQRASLLGVIDEFRTVFAEFTARQAVEMSAAIDGGRLHASHLSPHLVPAGFARYRHDAAYVVDNDGRLVSAFPIDAADLPAGIVRLVAAFRAERERRAAASTAEQPAWTDFIVVGDRLAVAAITTVGGRGRQGGQGAEALVTVAELDPRLVGVMEKTSGVDALGFDTGPMRDDRDVLSLLDQQGRIVGWLGWKTQSPMLTAVTRLSPLLAMVAACLIAFAALAIRQVRRSTIDLAESEAEAVRIANEDALTGLPNRRNILEVLDQALAMRPRGGVVCFAFLDLDGFKDVNEALGHQAGDQLLMAVAERLRAATAGAASVGRLGSDEFAVVVRADDALAAAQTAQDVIKEMTRPFWIAGQALQIGLTIGLAHAPRDGMTRDELTRRADLALRVAKRTTRGRAIAFEPPMEEELHDRRFVNRELRRTLAEGGLDVHYQPIVAAGSQRVIGVEALVRWRHPTRGDIAPMTFVPIAEQAGLMPKLGEFVLRRALSEALRWKDVYIAVNLSPVQVRDRHLVDLVATVIKETGIEPGRVVLEITEGVLIDNPEEARRRLEQLRALGVKIALDDFGSGYSSLSYLRRFPIDKLKIDREFVTPLGRSANGGVIMQAIIALGRALGLTVLCEGVETEEQRILLRLAGCDEMQGYLFARPGPAQEIDRLIGLAGAADARARNDGTHGY